MSINKCWMLMGSMKWENHSVASSFCTSRIQWMWHNSASQRWHLHRTIGRLSQHGLQSMYVAKLARTCYFIKSPDVELRSLLAWMWYFHVIRLCLPSLARQQWSPPILCTHGHQCDQTPLECTFSPYAHRVLLGMIESRWACICIVSRIGSREQLLICTFLYGIHFISQDLLWEGVCTSLACFVQGIEW